MFVRRKEFEELKSNMERLRRNVGKVNQELSAQGTVVTRHGKEIDNLERLVGVNNGYISFSVFGGQPEPAKKFNIGEKIDAILGYLGLTESVTEPNKLIPAPKKTSKKKAEK